MLLGVFKVATLSSLLYRAFFLAFNKWKNLHPEAFWKLESWGGKFFFWKLRYLDRCRNAIENAEVLHFWRMASTHCGTFWITHQHTTSITCLNYWTQVKTTQGLFEMLYRDIFLLFLSSILKYGGHKVELHMTIWKNLISYPESAAVRIRHSSEM